MSTRLLPNEKPRKKDFGTTSYKKPGPPTPSKNGGRPSLQGTENIHTNNESKTPKRSTPNRLRSLFKKRNSGIGDNSEVGLQGLVLSPSVCKTVFKNVTNFKPYSHPRHYHVPLVKCPKTMCIPEKKVICSKYSKRHRLKKIFRKMLSCANHLIFLVSMVVATHYIKSLSSSP